MAKHRSPERHQLIEVHVEWIEQLFNSIDPSPFHLRDLDPQAHDYIAACAKDLPRDAPIALVIHLDAPPADLKLALLDGAIHTHFTAAARVMRAQLRQLFRRGRISLLIGLACLSLSIALGQLSRGWLPAGSPSDILRESLLIGGWVAMWRPMEIFLYDWWPIAAEIRLLDRLAAMPVRVVQRHRKPPQAGVSSPVP